MQADMPFDLRDRLIALGADKRAASIPLNQRANFAADWIAGTVVALDDQAVHADYWESYPAGDKRLYLVEGRLAITLAREGTAETRVELQAGQAFIVPQGMWYRLHVRVRKRSSLPICIISPQSKIDTAGAWTGSNCTGSWTSSAKPMCFC